MGELNRDTWGLLYRAHCRKANLTLAAAVVGEQIEAAKILRTKYLS